jgi:hypothetical protein
MSPPSPHTAIEREQKTFEIGVLDPTEVSAHPGIATLPF